MSESVKYWIALNMVLGVGKTLFHRLVSTFGSPEEVSATLMQLELKGSIRQNQGKMFVANCNVDV